MKRKIIAVLVCMFSLANIVLCGCDNKSTVTNSEIVNVSVSFDAMAEFVKAVGKDKVNITTIIPAGTEPHDFEPQAQDLVNLSSADIFVYNGLGMEKWADSAVQAAGNDNLIVVDASTGVNAITNTEEDEISEHGQYDPHVWLSLKNAEIESKNILEALVKASPDNKDYFEKNYNLFYADLESLYTKYNDKFQTSANKSFVTGHAAFAYLCRDFGLVQNSVEDVFAEGEPTAQKLTELVEYCKDNNVKTVFVEEMVSPDVSQTLANEVGADVKTIYTIESSEADMSYLARMEANLKEIYDSLS